MSTESATGTLIRVFGHTDRRGRNHTVRVWKGDGRYQASSVLDGGWGGTGFVLGHWCDTEREAIDTVLRAVEKSAVAS